jgi:hypothetical protein
MPDMFLINNPNLVPKFTPTMPCPQFYPKGKIPSVFPTPLPNRLSSFPTISMHICR